MSRKQLIRVVLGLVIGLMGPVLSFLAGTFAMFISMTRLPPDPSEEQVHQVVAYHFDFAWWCLLIGAAIMIGGFGFAGYQVLCWLLGPQEGQATHE
jgi:hypothetical protein